jgi:hypothetical protein
LNPRAGEILGTKREQPAPICNGATNSCVSYGVYGDRFLDFLTKSNTFASSWGEAHEHVALAVAWIRGFEEADIRIGSSLPFDGCSHRPKLLVT